MRLAALIAIALTAGCQAAPDYTLKAGEALYCGKRFSIAIPESDKFQVDPATPEDFVLYHWQRPSGNILIYEGNHPQPGGVVFEVDKNGWPAVVVVHGTKDDANTVRIFSERPAACRTPETLDISKTNKSVEGSK